MSVYFLVKDLLSRPVVGPWARFLLAPLTALAWVYGRLLEARRLAYGRGWLRAERAGVPVISVGNVTAGGTGKTPCVEAVCRVLQQAGLRPAVLSRGYGRKGGPGWVAVSDGVRAAVGADDGGDEPVLLSARLPGVPILVGSDRRETARAAVARYGAQVLVLDDGFQHLALARDLDIVTVDATHPFGNGHTLPRGLLREPASALGHADLVVLTRAGKADGDRLERVNALVRACGTKGPVLASTHAAVRLADASGTPRPLESLAGLKVLAFAGIAHPPAFFQQLAALGAKVIEGVPYPDHHRFSSADVLKLAEWVGLTNAQAAVTTEKDAVRLTPFLPLPFELLVVGVELRFLDGDDVFRARILECASRR